ncbi:apovitellenin-1-like [Pelobates fuscus]|uniref:apovitellenin-1-like n=1 Tax=Pelobates fuscus TaxID=191477 RepID=UPI002FE4F4B5
MRFMFITGAFLLLLLTSDIDAKSISKRHVRRDWLIVPDSIGYYLYEAVNYVSPSAGKVMVDIFESHQVQSIRSFLIKETSQLNVHAENLYNKLYALWQNKEHRNTDSEN